MAEDASRGLGDPPSEVRITITRDPAARSLARLPAGTARRWVAVLAVATGAAFAVWAAWSVWAVWAVRPVRATQAPGGHERATRAGVAAAYGYPSGCLAVTASASDASYARADFNRALPCGRFAGDPTAIFHRSAGAWRAVLDAVSYPCPVHALPAAVQADLDVCPVIRISAG